VSAGRKLAPACLVTDFGETLSLPGVHHLIGQKPVDPAAAAALRVLHVDFGLRIGLASNTAGPGESRWPALALAGIDDVFAFALLSYPLGVAKPAALFYALALTAAQCAPGEVLWVGNNIASDVVAPMAAGMRAALVRPGGLRAGETVPDGALVIGHVGELPALISRRSS
jgi:FMN phosphatase YigB (HAD superfamily)